MDTLERYLNLATRGLWGQKKRDVRRELEGNIREMALEFRIAGLNETESIQRALEEFGAPQKVSVGMSKVYSAPVILRNTFLTAVIASMCISGLNASRAEIESQDRFPTEACVDPNVTSFKSGDIDIPCDGGSAWIRMADLKAELEPKGIVFKMQPGTGNSGAKYFVKFPGGREITLQTVAKTFSFVTSDGSTITVPMQADHMAFQNLLSELRNVGLPVVFENTKPIQINVGTTSFKIKYNTAFPASNRAVEDVLEMALDSFFPSQNGGTSNFYEQLLLDRGTPAVRERSRFYSHVIRVKKPMPNATYLLISRESWRAFMQEAAPADMPNTLRRARIAQLNKNSVFEYMSLAQNLEFLTEERTTQETEPNARFINNLVPFELATQKSGQVMLLEFTGRLDKDTFKILKPDQFSVSAK